MQAQPGLVTTLVRSTITQNQQSANCWWCCAYQTTDALVQSGLFCLPKSGSWLQSKATHPVHFAPRCSDVPQQLLSICPGSCLLYDRVQQLILIVNLHGQVGQKHMLSTKALRFDRGQQHNIQLHTMLRTAGGSCCRMALMLTPNSSLAMN